MFVVVINHQVFIHQVHVLAVLHVRGSRLVVPVRDVCLGALCAAATVFGPKHLVQHNPAVRVITTTACVIVVATLNGAYL